ncbi:pentatricopeptide repeat-containing protein At1g62914, mitochondrial-like [Pistacia vera]|uniref:pentatricopeptide repeat-containing protein At1g62914, mitochondrial-like n=1 Tax=Pistacia vera TaxID=55513 RepID=UPI001263533F|nr:pentatricopeptide repeat-containing protein At1g62914, mitochondrial-like [Pistacia vera]
MAVQSSNQIFRVSRAPCCAANKRSESSLTAIFQSDGFWESNELIASKWGPVNPPIINAVVFPSKTTAQEKQPHAGLVEKARQLLLEHMIKRGMVLDIYTYNILINGYCLADRIGDARELFDSITRKGYRPNVVKDARNLVGEMRLNDAFPNSWTYNIFIDGLCKNGRVLEALEMFNALVNNEIAVSIEGLNSLINGLCKTERLGTEFSIDKGNLKGSHIRSMLEVWQGYIAMEIELRHLNEARSIYKRCYSKRFSGTTSELRIFLESSLAIGQPVTRAPESQWFNMSF